MITAGWVQETYLAFFLYLPTPQPAADVPFPQTHFIPAQP
jgi:hypothetical protein